MQTSSGFQQLHGAGLGLTGHGGRPGRLDLFGRDGLLHGAAEPQDNEGRDATDGERDAPAPLTQVALGYDVLQDHQDQEGQHLAADQGDVLEAGEEAAALGGCGLGHVGCAGAVLATNGEALDDADQHQQDHGPQPNLLLCGQDGDCEGACGHQGHAQRQRGLAPLAVGVAAEEPGTDGTHEDRRREDGHGLKARLQVVLGIKEVRLKVGGKDGVDVEVVPLHEVAGRALEDIAHRPTGLGCLR